ncbi:MAG TPA: GAF domain-containing protein [Candidatus Methylacidiphilales bacterium]|jgi:GAF domain-containing protein|nr:GAF domain-containing protein [Candidatus Methylacidiphilales bacterium]
MDTSSPGFGALYWAYGICASVLGAFGIYIGSKTRSQSLRLMRQLQREKRRSDQLANFVIPIGLSLAAETDLNTLLEKILLEGKALSHADGGTLYLVTPEKTLRFGIVRNDSLKIAMGGTSGEPIAFPPLNLRDPVTGEPNMKNIATSCALDAKSISIADAYAAQGFDFSGAKAFDQKMNYRTTSVLCVPLKDTGDRVIGVLQLINAHDPENHGVIAFDEHLGQIIGLLGLLAAAALKSYLRVRQLTEELENLRIQIDEAKKERQVAEIAGSDYFKNLQARAREMRSKVKGRDDT